MLRCLKVLLLTILTTAIFVKPLYAATVGIHPPSAPVNVATAELRLTTSFSVPTVTPPSSVDLVLIITNVGSTTAKTVVIDNLLPVEFFYTQGVPAELQDLGDLAPGDTIKKSYAISIRKSVVTNRYVNETIASAANADSIQAEAPMNVVNGRVLGASDSTVTTLANTGQSPTLFLLAGFILVLVGARSLRRNTE